MKGWKTYKALVQDYNNPLFFISGSSFNLYDLLTHFCQVKEIPKAPFLLRDLGLEKQKWLKKDTQKYKLQYIEQILPLYPEMQFILIGDSGQKDPEIYKQVCEKYPGRIKAVYIREVESAERARQLKNMAQDMDVEMLLMEHSRDALQHARDKAWIS